VYKQEELYWQWILEGDSNTRYFHSVANGRTRKCMIEFLGTECGRITGHEEFVQHIEQFYKMLFGIEERGTNMWHEKGKLNADQKEWLISPFTVEEVEHALEEMKTETAPEPDDFPVIFYKKFWGTVRWWIIQMMGGFHKGDINLSKIN
jgi:hypothetical protein